MNHLTIAKIAVRQDAQGRYCLNDLHKAAVAQGANPRTKEPGKFLASPRTQELIDLIRKETITQNLGNASTNFVTQNLGNEIAPVNTVQAGDAKLQGTFVVIELVIAYGQFVSAAFDLKVIRTFLQVVNQDLNLPKIQSHKFWDKLRPHWAAIAHLALLGLKNKVIAAQLQRSAGSVGRCLMRMYEVGYLNPVEVFTARLKPETALRWALQKPVATTWGEPASAQQLTLFAA